MCVETLFCCNTLTYDGYHKNMKSNQVHQWLLLSFLTVCIFFAFVMISDASAYQNNKVSVDLFNCWFCGWFTNHAFVTQLTVGGEVAGFQEVHERSSKRSVRTKKVLQKRTRSRQHNNKNRPEARRNHHMAFKLSGSNTYISQISFFTPWKG